LEGTQIDLVHLCEEVRISTNELAKSAAIWYPKYEAAACIISEFSFKLEKTDKKIRGIYCDENLLQHMAQLSESKVQGLKDMVSSSVLAQCRPQLENILNRLRMRTLLIAK
jgi:pyridoxal/pyridoxine/pyridoxamine kinase